MMTAKVTKARVEEMKLRVADVAEKIAVTEDAMADTLEQAALVGEPEHRGRRRELAAEARAFADQERLEAERWRTIHTLEQRRAESHDAEGPMESVRVPRRS